MQSRKWGKTLKRYEILSNKSYSGGRLAVITVTVKQTAVLPAQTPVKTTSILLANSSTKEKVSTHTETLNSFIDYFEGLSEKRH